MSELHWIRWRTRVSLLLSAPLFLSTSAILWLFHRESLLWLPFAWMSMLSIFLSIIWHNGFSIAARAVLFIPSLLAGGCAMAFLVSNAVGKAYMNIQLIISHTSLLASASLLIATIEFIFRHLLCKRAE